MEPEEYRIEILHYINPYLLWVEIPDEGADGDHKLEQIGVFGVLPMEMTLDLVEDTLLTKRSSAWMPAASVLMANIFSEAVEVYFVPACIDDQRSTIFDDNIHKYGEIIVKKPNGKYRILSKLLVKSGFAKYDEDLFEAELSAGKIKTKLSHNTTKDVIKIIAKKTKTKIEKQTNVFKTAQNIESELTVKNLEAHNRRTNSVLDYEDLLQRKLNDLQMCKDAEKESVGRASKKKEKEDTSSLLKRKTKIKKLSEGTGVAAYFAKRLEKLNRIETKSEKSDKLDVREDFEESSDISKNNNDVIEIKNKLNALKKLQSAKIKTKSVVANENKDILRDHPLTEVKPTEIKDEVSFDGYDFDEIRPKKVKKPKQLKITPRLPEYNKHTETRVVFGPPDANINVLPIKVVPKDTLIVTYDVPETKKEDIPMKKVKEDLYDNEDSDIDIESDENFVENKTLSAISDTVDATNPEHNKTNNLISPKKVNNVFCNPKTITKDSEKSKDMKPNPDAHVQIKQESLLKKKLRMHKENLSRKINSSTSDTSNKDSSTSFEEDKRLFKKEEATNSSMNIESDEDSVSEVLEKLSAEYTPIAVLPKKEEKIEQHIEQVKCNVNPFKNVDPNISVFVEKLVTPVLLVHSKINKRFLPVFKIRDVPFNTHIQIVLRNMSIEQPMMLQTLTWPVILRGYTTIMIGPKRSGKTMGYLPAVCRLISDHDSGIEGVGPSCIIVCATSNLVTEVESIAKIFLGKKEKILAIYSGIDELDLVTSLLNGCDLLICTPSILVRSLQTEYGIDLRRLTTFVLDDCERLAEVYGNEVKFFMIKIKEMLKSRLVKEVKVQYILASRIWCDFMEPLAKKAPDTVVCIGAFQECVLYSKAHTVASFVTKDKKVKSVLEFLNEIDTSKRTVIVCRTDEEVQELEKILIEKKYVVFATNNEMTVQNLYNLRGLWDDYQEPIIGPILVCCDGNLTHLNITDAHYLIHYSLPNLFSTFCKRFSVLNDNYASIFRVDNDDIKIKILLEESNTEQLPKIVHFIKRCTTDVPKVLDQVCEKILDEKDHMKAKKLVPICDSLMTLGECPDFWNCQERHAILKDCDEPQEWIPQNGVITFKILHFHTAVFYSARLLTHTSNGETVKYPQNYNMLAMKLSMHFSRESNRKLISFPKVGDICAVSIRQNFFSRCQIVKILSYYEKKTPNYVLVRLIDEERLEKTRDIYLYYLPEELQKPQTHVLHVRLANIRPKDKDVTFSELAKDELKKITHQDKNEEDIFMRAKISLTINNCILVDTVETCRDLSFMNTVVLDDFKKELLDRHAIPNPEHLEKLEKLCIEGGLTLKKQPEIIEIDHPIKKLPAPQWAHLEKDDLSAVYFASAQDPSTFFLRLVKFEQCCSVLIKDIQKHVEQNPTTVHKTNIGDIVLARLPDDGLYERARIDEIIDNDKVSCFFVDQGDWREVSKQHLLPITERFIAQMPFQAIECRLVGVRPAGENWTEFATNWFTNCFEDNNGDLKQIYAKYLVKEKPENTGGHKYGVVLIDTNSEQDIVINELIMEVNLAQEEHSEINYLHELDFKKETGKQRDSSDSDDDKDDDWEKISKKSKDSSNFEEVEAPCVPLRELFPEKPIRSVPLIGSDESDLSEDKWNINMTADFMALFRPANMQKLKTNDLRANLPAIKDTERKTSDTEKPFKNQSKSDFKVSATKTWKNQTARVYQNSDSEKDSCSEIKASKIAAVTSPKIKELDSDDLTSTASSHTSVNNELLKEIDTKKFVTIENVAQKKEEINTVKKPNMQDNSPKEVEKDLLRKPKLLWWQKGKTLSVKILLIGVEKYEIKIEERRLQFFTEVNDTTYGFDLELYGIVDIKNCRHANKGQYILVNLTKLMNRNWLTLTKNGGVLKWIAYDVDSIDISSDEEEDNDVSKEVLKHLCKETVNSDSEDEEFLDDVNFRYSR